MSEPAGRILLVDDEPALIAILEPALRAAGYIVSIAADGAAALRQLEETEPQLMLLDLGLPDTDGKDVIDLIRQRSDVPIIVLSARHQENEKIAALDRGADDYVHKPFEIGELMARIRVALRRSQAARSVPVEVTAGDLKIELESRRVSIEGQMVKLSPKEWKLLQELSLSAGQVVPHQRLLAAVWSNKVTDQQYLRIYVGLLRQKLEADASRPVHIRTEPGIGYRLAAPGGQEVQVKFAQ
jgi:two-component system KDP operon response regulator KdpE